MKVVKNFERVITVPPEGAALSPRDRETIRPEMKNRIERVLITRKLIRKRVKALAREISAFYRGEGRLEMLFILEGASIFAAELAQEIYSAAGPEVRSQSLKARAYGPGLKDEGEISRPVKILYAPSGLEGKRLLLVEDIVDQGFTLHTVSNWLESEAGAEEVRICALLDKQLRNPSPAVKKMRERLTLDWVGFQIPDRWVAGYGIDAGEDFRFLPFVVIIREDYYRQGG